MVNEQAHRGRDLRQNSRALQRSERRVAECVAESCTLAGDGICAALARPSSVEAYYSRLMDKRILTIAITGPAFTQSRGLAALAVNGLRSSFHVFPRVLLLTSTSSGRRR